MRSGLLLALLLPVAALAYKPAAATNKYRSSSFGNAEYMFSPTTPMPIGDGVVTISAINGLQAPTVGYLPFWVQLRNNGAQSRTLRLDVTGTNGGGTFSRVVELKGLETRRVSLPVPTNIGGAQIEVSGSGINYERTHVYFSPYLNTSMLAIGSEDDFRRFAGKGPSTSAPDLAVLTMSAQEIPDELSALVGFSGISLLGSDMASLTDGQRRVLEQYAASGGLLVIETPSRALKSYLPLWDGHDASLGVDYGFGRLIICNEGQTGCGIQALEMAYTQGFVVNPLGPTPSYMRGPFGSRYYPDRPSDALLPQAAPPVGRFLLIMILFTLAVGPGSLFVARKKGPLFVLVTIPGVALVTCLGIAGYSAFVDGFAVHTTTRGFTLLDSKSARAITVGIEAFYANLTPDGPQHSSSTAIIFPTERYNAQSASIEWSGGPKFQGDFIPSRTYREWGVISVEPTRARLVVKSGERPKVLNALGGNVVVGYVRHDDALWKFTDVADGAEGSVEKVGKGDPATEVLAGMEGRGRFTDNVEARMREPLREGQFLVKLASPGMIPLGGMRTVHNGDVHVVRGEVH